MQAGHESRVELFCLSGLRELGGVDRGPGGGHWRLQEAGLGILRTDTMPVGRVAKSLSISGRTVRARDSCGKKDGLFFTSRVISCLGSVSSEAGVAFLRFLLGMCPWERGSEEVKPMAAKASSYKNGNLKCV